MGEIRYLKENLTYRTLLEKNVLPVLLSKQWYQGDADKTGYWINVLKIPSMMEIKSVICKNKKCIKTICKQKHKIPYFLLTLKKSKSKSLCMPKTGRKLNKQNSFPN